MRSPPPSASTTRDASPLAHRRQQLLPFTIIGVVHVIAGADAGIPSDHIASGSATPPDSAKAEPTSTKSKPCSVTPRSTPRLGTSAKAQKLHQTGGKPLVVVGGLSGFDLLI